MAANSGPVGHLLRAMWFLLAVYCCSGQSASLTISIDVSDPTNGGTPQTVELSFDSSERRIEVAPGLMYTFTCTPSGGLSDDSPIWFRDSVAVTRNRSQRVYAMAPNNNFWNLVFMNFSGMDDVGRYSCSYSGEMLTLNIGTANPAVISSTPSLIFNSGIQGSNRPSLRPFVSGNPFPETSQGTWLFNGGMMYPPSSGPFSFSRDFLLNPTLSTQHTGTYSYTVVTSGGTATVNFTVLVIIDPSVQSQPISDQVLLEGQSLNITCSDSAGVPPPTFTWRFNGTDLQADGDRVVIMSDPNSTHLLLSSASLQDSGNYQCVARNHPVDMTRYRAQDIGVTVLRPPMPPENIQAVSTSPCVADVTWTTPSIDSTTATTDMYILEIQLMSNNSAEEWVELDRSPSPPLQVSIPSRGLNTTYNLRGRGYNMSLGSGANSVPYGPFVSYSDRDLPALMDVEGFSVWSEVIRMTWTVDGSACFMLDEVSVSCGSVVASEGEGNSRLVTGLEPDTEYNCSVSGVLTENNVVVGNPRIGEMVVVTVRANTLPRAASSPLATPSVDSTSNTVMDRFTVNLKSLGSDQGALSNYHIVILRLSSVAAIPDTPPDILYPNISSISCREGSTPSTDGVVTTYQPYIAAEVDTSDFPTKFVVGGGNSKADPGEQVQCNDRLVPGGVYTVFIRAYPICESCRERSGSRMERQATQRQYEVFSSSDYMPATVAGMEPTDATQASTSDSTAIIAVPIVVVIFLLVVIVLAFGALCCCRRMRTKSLTFSPSVDHSLASSDSDLARYPDTPDLGSGRRKNGIELKAMEAFADPIDMSFQPSGSIRKEEFSKHVEKMDAKRQLLFTEEFDWIGKKSPWHQAEASNLPENDQKNRYSNITAFDHSAVKLKPKPGLKHSDYINANFIAGYSKAREYIATQGPLDQTVEDFWRMVWEQQSTTIIMLTNLVELGKIKCSQYWPISSKTMYGDIAVTLESTHTFPDYTIRTLGVQSAKTNEQRRVLQFHYIKWPDYGTPKLAAPLLNFLRMVHESNASEERTGPMVVHCSAGVGRSGTVLTIDYCLQQLRKEGMADVCKFVCSMREQRNYMVQTDQQYSFIHYAILEAITYGDTSYDVQGFLQSYSKLQTSSPSSSSSPNKLLLAEEFDRLGVVKTMVKKSSFQNRIRVKGAPQRHFHSSFHGGSASGSLQQCLGHFIDGYNQSGMFVLTEGPDEYTALRFWEIIWDHNCNSIIMLTPLDTEELFCYWPESDQAEIQFGSIKVMVESESAEHLYTCRRIRLTNTKVEGISHQLVQYQFLGWMEDQLPRVPDFVSFVCDIVKKLDEPSETRSKVLVHDLATLGPAGVFCSFFYSIQRLQAEKMVDIFQAVQMIQLQRPGCVTQIEEYAFLYDCLHEFLIKNS